MRCKITLQTEVHSRIYQALTHYHFLVVVSLHCSVSLRANEIKLAIRQFLSARCIFLCMFPVCHTSIKYFHFSLFNKLSTSIM